MKSTIASRYDTLGEDSYLYLPDTPEAPIFATTLWGTERFYSARIVKGGYKHGKNTYIVLDRPMYEGTIFHSNRSPKTQFVIKKKINGARFEFLYEIILKDAKSIVSLHLDLLRINSLIYVDGDVTNCKHGCL